MSRSRKQSHWKRGLWFTVGLMVLLSALAAFEITVLLPRRLERERQARRDAPSKLVPPSQRVSGEAGGDPARHIVTAFRIEEWRASSAPAQGPPEWKGAAADVYLEGYMAFQEGEKFVANGDLAAARQKFELAAKVFEMIREREPEFEPAMVAYRQRKIAEALTALPEVPEAAEANQR